MMSDLSLFYTFFCYRFKLLLIDEVDRDAVCEAVLRSLFNSNTRASGVGGAATEGEPPEVHTSHKGSLLTTLTNIVSERMAMGSGGVATERQPFLSAEQELTAYLSEPVIPVRSPDGKINAQDLLDYWYRHKNEWPFDTKLSWKLVYPDGQYCLTLPGQEDQEFTLRKYKEDLGKPYNRITLYLTHLALSYLSCPPSSVISERVFSLTGNS